MAARPWGFESLRPHLTVALPCAPERNAIWRNARRYNSATLVDRDARNPFRYGALALDDAFTDRKAEIRELETDIRNGQDVVLLAPRRYGKSSLVWRVAQRLVRKRVLVAQVDLMTTPTKERLAEKLSLIHI